MSNEIFQSEIGRAQNKCMKFKLVLRSNLFLTTQHWDKRVGSDILMDHVLYMK